MTIMWSMWSPLRTVNTLDTPSSLAPSKLLGIMTMGSVVIWHHPIFIMWMEPWDGDDDDDDHDDDDDGIIRGWWGWWWSWWWWWWWWWYQKRIKFRVHGICKILHHHLISIPDFSKSGIILDVDQNEMILGWQWDFICWDCRVTVREDYVGSS